MDWKSLTPADFSKIKRFDGPVERHIEQLWDEIFRLREQVKQLKNEVNKINQHNTKLP